LRPYDPPKKVLEIGFHLQDKYWGKGLAQEAGSAVIDYAFTTMDVSAIFAGHNPQNPASAHALTKLGFSYTHDEFYPSTGRFHPSYLLTRQVYEINKSQ